jgi:SAM-dependent methyltransferase
MKLSELVAYKTSLDQYDFIRTSRGLIKKINESQTDINNAQGVDGKIRFGEGVYKEQLASDLGELENRLGELQNNYSYYREQVNELILDQEQEYITRCEKQFVSRVLGEGIEGIQRRRLVLTSEQKKQFITRLNLYADWRWPGLLIRPEDQDIVEAMCAFDPLYLADIYQSLLDPYIKKFNPVYQNRLRPYQISKFIPRKKTLDVLPQQQFGFVAAYNLFDHYPLYMIKQMLTEIEQLLKPGGVFLFTFNNCDLARNIATFERGQRSYTPWRLLQPIIQELGFKIIQTQTQEHNWCEIRKPGTLKSIRGGQAVAKINYSETKLLTKTYTADQKEHIRQEAIDLGIDSESAIRAGGTNIGKLELAVTRKREQLRLLELNKTLGERLPWSASNKGYAKGQHVRFNGKNYIALVNVLPKQRFEQGEWELVE